MKRFSIGELLLLCLPVVFIAGVGFVLSRQKPIPNPAAPQLTFRVEPPTTLEAFSGTNAVLLLGISGRSAEKVSIQQSNPTLELHTKKGVVKSSLQDGTSGFWDDAWKGVVNSDRFLINEKSIPAGRLFLHCKAVIGNNGFVRVVSPNGLSQKGRWEIKRSQIKPFPFAQMSRRPWVSVKSVSITKAKKGNVEGEVTFRLEDPSMGAETSFDKSFSSGFGMSYGSVSNPKAEVRIRRLRWSFDAGTGARARPLVHVSGRASADERWPLGFEFEPFYIAKIKVGQKLRFKTFPVPIPSQART